MAEKISMSKVLMKNSFIQPFNLSISNHLYGVYTLYGEAILLFNGEKKRIMGVGVEKTFMSRVLIKTVL